jgi:predicted pyridoxine 5'-phosphate oxidase superfamily flavin-nucleotide-binding protein
MSIARFHDGSRRLQDRFDSRRIADRLDQVTFADALDADDRDLIEGSDHFFLASADAEGRPDCSYKGGLPGFVRVLSPHELAWPDYDGNGQFRSLGNLLVNANAGLLFVDWERPGRLRVNGTARVADDDPLVATWEGAQMVVRLAIRQVFPNCPRYIHRMQRVDTSAFVPREGHECPRPGWKNNPAFADALPAKDRRPG